MWSKYKCPNCKAEILYPNTAPDTYWKCTTFLGNDPEGYCLGTLVYMEDVSMVEVKRQRRRPYEHGKSNNTTN